MSYATVIDIEVDGVEESIVLEVMKDLDWDGSVIDTIDGVVYFEAGGNICMGTNEWKQEELIRDSFNKKLGREVDVNINWG